MYQETSALPIPLTKTLLPFVPSSVLAHVIELVWSRMERRHPKLIKNLARLDKALVYFEPTDMPHSFALVLGEGGSFYLLPKQELLSRKPDAHVKGILEALVDMLEGREDGDALFFSRDIHITGDTEVIVGLRNTLDREEIDLMEEALSLCGPFAKPAHIATDVANRIVMRTQDHIKRVHGRLHVKEVSE